MAKRGPRHRRARGLVLFEVMVSLVVFSAGIIAVMRAVSVCLQTRGDIESYSMAMFLAQQAMSELEGAMNPAELPVSGTFHEPYSQFNWKRSLTQTGMKSFFTASPDDDLDLDIEVPGAEPVMPQNVKMPVIYKATVTVGWTRRGTYEEFTTATLVPPREPREKTPAGAQKQKRKRGR
jgi:hypothetical protein